MKEIDIAINIYRIVFRVVSTLVSKNYPDFLILYSQKSKNSPLEQAKIVKESPNFNANFFRHKLSNF